MFGRRHILFEGRVFSRGMCGRIVLLQHRHARSMYPRLVLPGRVDGGRRLFKGVVLSKSLCGNPMQRGLLLRGTLDHRNGLCGGFILLGRLQPNVLQLGLVLPDTIGG